ncbi:phosphoserine phosphatase SerB [Methanobrevibacter sp. OttesenSCG-928-K11]|nr:phosphoserine phosphatase SerB [Methanobrevibacter sp. OttesenSCG-928-K11]MDL2271228.1 phosphoserine phosphatase SerB [Methanobrevibacter sp. OttesenSCG-928-I08]
MIKLIVFDLDNVIIDGEAIDEIGKLNDVEDKISEITENAMQGKIDFETSIKDRVKLLEGVSVEDVKKIAEDLPLMEGAEETIKTLKDDGYEVAIISGSFDIIADQIKDKLGVDYVFTNSLTEEDGKLTGEVTGPLVSGHKVDVLKSLIEDKDISLNEVIAVGDGANDISMIEVAKCGIAFNAKPSLKEIADVIVEDKDLTKVLEVIEENKSSDDSEEQTTESAEEEVVEEVEEPPVEKAIKNLENEDSESPEKQAAETAEVEEKIENEATTEEKTEEETTNSEDEKPSKDNKKSKKDDLPVPDFDLADTMEGVKDQKNEREALISEIADEREEFNKIAKEQRKIRDELNDSLKEKLNKAIEYRNERNEINKEVEAAKKLRNDVNNKLKNLEWSSGKRDKIKIENEIKKIDKIIETRVLDIKKENQLVKNANDLRKQLMDIHEDETVKEEAQDLKTASEEHHAKVVELSERAQEAHENMLVYFKQTDEIRTAADDAHKQFIDARKNASAKHEDFKKVLGEIHVINKKLGSQKPRRRKSDKQSGSNGSKNREEKERAEAIFDKFKNGKKLSTDELLLLQKYNIG